MLEIDRERFAEVMTGVAELYGRQMSDTLLDVYWRALQHFEVEAVVAALSRHALNPDVGQFMPKPADVVRAIDGGGEGRAALAWTKAAEAVRRVGGYASVVFDDPVTQAVIADMGGWTQLCDTLMDPTSEDTNFPFVARDFERRYRAYLNAPATLHYPRLLLGRIDAYNAKFDKPPQNIRLIGDRQAAQRVLEQGGDSDASALQVSLPQQLREVLPADGR